MRVDSRVGLIILAVGISSAIVKKSKPLARYVGDQLIRAGEYMKHGMEEAATVMKPPVATVPPADAAVPVADVAVEAAEAVEVPEVTEPVADAEAAVTEPTAAKKKRKTDA